MNTLDPQYFEENIRAAYELRKIRHMDKNDGQLEMDYEIYNLLKGSNQIVHNRGKALSYMNEKKRPSDPTDATVRHEYEKKRQLTTGPLANPSERMRPGDGFKMHVMQKYATSD